jgi:ABC-type lipoprotein export system ATPase subunit
MSKGITMLPIVEALHVDKRFRSHNMVVSALTDVTFTVAHGEIVAIMGPSGSGKTTLLNCLAGLDTTDNGRILIAGTDLAKLSDGQRTDFRARTMGFIFQSFNLLPVLSAVENVELPLLIAGQHAGTARRKARDLLNLVGLHDRERHLPAELSGGQRQRVAIARALINDPAIVWADEPTGNLDSESAQEVMDLLCHLNREYGQTLVLVTHAFDIGARAHRMLGMRDGRMVALPPTRPPDEIRDSSLSGS